MSRRTARAAKAAAKQPKAEEKAASKTRGRVVPDLSLWSQFQRIGGNLTPLTVSAIIREADTGSMQRLCDLGNEARQKSPTLQCVLATSEEAIAGLDWEFELPEKPKRKEIKAAKIVEAHLRTIGLERLFAHQTGARFYGYAVSESFWAKVDAFLFPSSFNHLAPRRFGFRQDTGAFVWRDDEMAQEGVDFRTAYPRKFIVSQPRVTGDVPCREGLIRVLMWCALFENWTIGDWLKLGEIAWRPWRKGKYKKGTSEEDIANLTAILEGLTTSGVATHSDDVEVDISWAKGGGGGEGKSSHAELAATMAAMMAKAVLGQTLTTDAGDRGARSLGEVHDSIRKDLREATARYVADDINRDLISHIFEINWGAGVRPARLKFLTDDAADMDAMASAIEKLAGPKVGLKIPAKWVRDELGIPEPEEGEECVGGAAPVAEMPKPGEEPNAPKTPSSPKMPNAETEDEPAAEDEEDEPEDQAASA